MVILRNFNDVKIYPNQLTKVVTEYSRNNLNNSK